MANLKSSKKDIRRTLKRTKRNASQKSEVRTLLKKAKTSVLNTKNYKEGITAIVAYEKKAMRAKKLFSKKSVSKHISELVKALKSRFQQAEQVA